MQLTRLRRFDAVKLRDIYATNPATGKPTPHLQYFAVVYDIDGDTIPRASLYPFINQIAEPIAMADVVNVNGHPIERWLELETETSRGDG